MKRVLILSPTTDFAGVGINLKRAFDASTIWQARHVRGKPSIYAYPADLEWVRSNKAVMAEINELFRLADVVHVMDLPNILNRFDVGRQRIVVQHLGTRYRNDPAAVSAVCRRYRAIEITDSFDLMVFPHVRWVPVAVDTQALYGQRLRRYNPQAGITRIAHAPTDPATSDTAVVVAAVERLRQNFDVQLDLIERVSNAECIARKAQADIYVDRFGIGFGVNAIECWAMGIPVISGMTDPAAKGRALAEFGRLPWYDATADTLYDALRQLITDRRAWIDYSRRGLDHAERYHSFHAVVERVTDVYVRALAREAVPA